MSIITCGLAGEGVFAAVIPFSIAPYDTVFEYDKVSVDFLMDEKNLDFKVETPVVEFEIDVIRIEECSFPQ